MKLHRLIYSIIVVALLPLALLRLAWRARRQPEYLRHVGERFGFYRIPSVQPLVWIHAVSVGETRAAEPLVRALRAAHPDYRVLLTHMTPTGRQTSVQLFGDEVLRAYLPYDLPFAVNRFLRHFRPALGVLMETELWPNLIHCATDAQIPVALVNARLSQRSARGYARLGRLIEDTLSRVAAIGAQSQTDATRLRELGGKSVEVTGNMKFDRSPGAEDLQLGRALRSRLGTRFVLLAASTREGEEELLLDALNDLLGEILLVIVPRHPQRFEGVARLLARRGIHYQRRSDDSPIASITDVVLGDSMGEMFAYYAACDLAFIGGSLLPLGGQNLLEACAAGKPTVVGPHMFNFSEATRLALEAGAAVQIADVKALREVVGTLRTNAARRARMGEAGKKLMLEHQGATARTLQLIERVLTHG
ncbi:MAG TPA: lipid IV(A) 3-deoxy-D-manno-octulosonic acid transferase [Burkholderiales bacterium]|nr:lipid IV(A) 3-deoxy-D-manno-octulosonic acid transferase [Burkholderiales bacterium]